MALPLQVPLFAGATVVLFVVADLLARELVRAVVARRGGARPVVPTLLRLQQQLAGTAARLIATVALLTALAASSAPHKVALIFTVGATYFAAALLEGSLRYRLGAAAPDRATR
jgi:hypothetical protein